MMRPTFESLFNPKKKNMNNSIKNLVINSTFLLFALTICSFQTPNPTVQEIFQEALNIEGLAPHLAKGDDGKILPLTIATNGLLSENIDLSLNGEMVAVINLATKNETTSILNLKEIKMKGKKSILLFQYGEKSIKIRLKKEGNDWVAKMITVKWKNGFETEIVSSSETHF